MTVETWLLIGGFAIQTGGLIWALSGKLSKINVRLDTIDKRLEDGNKRFGKIDKKMEKILTNHLPHLQLDLTELKGDIKSHREVCNERHKKK